MAVAQVTAPQIADEEVAAVLQVASLVALRRSELIAARAGFDSVLDPVRVPAGYPRRLTEQNREYQRRRVERAVVLCDSAKEEMRSLLAEIVEANR
jgi:hypothetical protein